MTKNKSKNKRDSGQVQLEQVNPALDPAEDILEPSQESSVPAKKYKYNPAAAKAYRQRVMEFAKKGGYEPKPKAEGTGLTEKRTSKTGTTYYYQPWSTLTDDQKKARLAQARERSARDRDMARKYREEHPEEPSLTKEA